MEEDAAWRPGACEAEPESGDAYGDRDKQGAADDDCEDDAQERDHKRRDPALQVSAPMFGANVA